MSDATGERHTSRHHPRPRRGCYWEACSMNTRCKSCNAPIVWVRTVGDARMPIDAYEQDGRIIPKEIKDGNVILDNDRRGVLARTVKKGQGTHQSHFASCPHAAEWRGKRR